MGGFGAFILIVAAYLLLWVLYAKPVKISQEGVEAYPRIFWRSHTRWDEVDHISVDDTYVVLKLKPGSLGSSAVRIPVRLARSAQEILDHIDQYRPDLTRPHFTSRISG
jgi:D-alanine-D-alanine ligase-like ATP-grasp enzyme